MSALTNEVRRLIELTVTCDLPHGEAEVAAADLRTIGDRLAAHVPQEAYPRFVIGPEIDSTNLASAMRDSMPYDVMMGRYNPLALPLTIRAESGSSKAYGSARFTKAYEGGPGWVHGAVIAGAFDIVLTAANQLENAAGPTIRLSVRYRRPTLIDEESSFEGWIDHRTDRRVVSKGHLIQRGEITAEAEGEFATARRTDLSVAPASEV